MRKKIIIGNWKMNKTPSEAKVLCKKLIKFIKNDSVDIVLCVPFIDIPIVVDIVKNKNIEVGAENMYFEEKGAYTGEISAAMLVDSGVKYVIIGHSERRYYFKETNYDVNKKIKKAFEYNLIPIMCCGESLDEREKGTFFEFIKMQIIEGLKGLDKYQVARMIIAYEPIWAIGTGKTATSIQAEEVCRFIRDIIKVLYDDATGELIRIQYGGSINVENAIELFDMRNIDGGLIGGSSLKLDFASIINLL